MSFHNVAVSIEKHLRNGLKAKEAVEAALVDNKISLDPFKIRILVNLIEKEQAEMKKVEIDVVDEKDFSKIAKK